MEDNGTDRDDEDDNDNKDTSCLLAIAFLQTFCRSDAIFPAGAQMQTTRTLPRKRSQRRSLQTPAAAAQPCPAPASTLISTWKSPPQVSSPFAWRSSHQRLRCRQGRTQIPLVAIITFSAAILALLDATHSFLSTMLSALELRSYLCKQCCH